MKKIFFLLVAVILISFQQKKEVKTYSLTVVIVLSPIKQEYYSKLRLLIKRLNFSLKLNVCLCSIFPLV